MDCWKFVFGNHSHFYLEKFEIFLGDSQIPIVDFGNGFQSLMFPKTSETVPFHPRFRIKVKSRREEGIHRTPHMTHKEFSECCLTLLEILPVKDNFTMWPNNCLSSLMLFFTFLNFIKMWHVANTRPPKLKIVFRIGPWEGTWFLSKRWSWHRTFSYLCPATKQHKQSHKSSCIVVKLRLLLLRK